MLQPNSINYRTAAFTLIELLTVIAIVGILAAIVIPTVGKVRETAQRAVDANNLREIAKAASLFAAENDDLLPGINISATSFRPSGTAATTTPHLWAGALARAGILTDPGFYSSRLDPQRPATLPVSLLATTEDGPELDPDFAAMPLSVELVGGLRLRHPAGTPVAFTRGLLASGEWDSVRGVYGESGGYIAFLGGHVTFHRDLTGSGALVASNGRPTSNLLQALPYSASATAQNPNPRVYADDETGGIGRESGTSAIAPP